MRCAGWGGPLRHSCPPAWQRTLCGPPRPLQRVTPEWRECRAEAQGWCKQAAEIAASGKNVHATRSRQSPPPPAASASS